MRLTIADIAVGQGMLGISACPGRTGFYDADLIALRNWHPALVVSFITAEELARTALTLGPDLDKAGIAWAHHPTPDYAVPDQDWAQLSAQIHAKLSSGHKVLLHCMGGCGRSGSAALRLMVETGEAPDPALTRLRAVRPCAVETPEQFLWASQTSKN